MANIGGLGGDIADLGDAVGSLFNAEGNAAEANSYTSAAQLEEQNAQLTAASTRIQETQQARTMAQSLGTTQADVASAGFTESGSALDILKSSAQQGSLAKSLINIQGAINENSYAAEAGADTAKAKAANEANTAGTISAIASIGGALVSGGEQLASAGTTVSKGYDLISGLFSDTVAGSAGEEVAGAGEGTSDLLIGDDVVDTSQIALGTSTTAATEGISDALASDVGFDIAGDTAGSITADAIAAGAEDAGAEIGASVAADAATDAVGSSILDIAGDAIVAASVICTALYQRKLISSLVWIRAQKYGYAMDRTTFYGYLFWATPIAQGIQRSERFAHFVAPIFVPSIIEMGVITGECPIKGPLYGRISHRVLFGLSWSFGRILKGVNYVTARA